MDLAGSERMNKANTQGQTTKEGISINKGLLMLGNCLKAIAEKSRRKFPTR